MYALKTLLDRPLRFVLTVAGVAACVILMLFLLSVYRGVEEGSVEYVRAADADLWVLQRHATNVLRSTSMLSTEYGARLEDMPGVASASAILFIIAGVEVTTGTSTTYITGFDSETGRGGPPRIAEGHNVMENNEIVVDRSFAAKHGIGVGDRLPIKDDVLTVVGLSSGTNMFVIQYAFVTLAKAQEIAGCPSIVSCYQVRTRPGADPDTVSERIASELADTVVYDRQTFIANNTREMESGILPLLYVVALIGALVLATILSLILSVNVLERREDFAVMKALGAPRVFIPTLVVQQAFAFAAAGTAAGIGLFFPMVELVARLAPEISPLCSLDQILVVAAGTVAISLSSSIVPNLRLRHVYPMEVFG